MEHLVQIKIVLKCLISPYLPMFKNILKLLEKYFFALVHFAVKFIFTKVSLLLYTKALVFQLAAIFVSISIAKFQFDKLSLGGNTNPRFVTEISTFWLSHMPQFCFKQFLKNQKKLHSNLVSLGRFHHELLHSFN